MSVTLHGKKILITREEKQAKEFSEKVLQYGGTPVEVPLLRISCKDIPDKRQVFMNLHRYKWVFFTSANGVECFFKLAKKYKCTSDVLSECKLAAVGHKTASCLSDHGYEAHFIPSTYNAEVMANEFTANHSKMEEPILLIRGNRSRDVLPVWFNELEITFDQLEVYETAYNFQAETELNRVIQREKLDFITFTSPSTVEAFFEMKKNQITSYPEFVCIGTTTSERAAELGIKHTLTPENFTIDGMLNEISNYLNERG
ncbi:uroporphyrinogen-III synthase [Virgibacillus doumboii]|uniref:uroporphyrinogen-III synthase n=1 Tax=Virgibacillus doumboii TaxID=2697503 RepID=UPI0013E07898|nr:uroporphyrinogen-III synthase [Virgibacillus doumboii]